ncbi:hypothetical protein [Nocardia sp. NBC_01327]|uniref:hypothetical protein n=1 Tax=Nocardia sp. NBC_01327 TaxID=2903593 RepID=UPI002E1132E1|nr:hypothetical protein OG326_29170 [Nocardia sp. NBC_01327]
MQTGGGVQVGGNASGGVQTGAGVQAGGLGGIDLLAAGAGAAGADTVYGMTIPPAATVGIGGGTAVTDQVPAGGYVIPKGAPETGAGGMAHAVSAQ